MNQRQPVQSMSHVGIGGRVRVIATDFDLGVGRWRCRQEYGLRRSIWDAAYGYVSGFRKRDIAYYLLTRSLSSTLHRTTIRIETRHADRATCPHQLIGPVGIVLMCFDCGSALARERRAR
ncbi:hypothetical protein [Microbacterium maritypicum]